MVELRQDLWQTVQVHYIQVLIDAMHCFICLTFFVNDNIHVKVPELKMNIIHLCLVIYSRHSFGKNLKKKLKQFLRLKTKDGPNFRLRKQIICFLKNSNIDLFLTHNYSYFFQKVGYLRV